MRLQSLVHTQRALRQRLTSLLAIVALGFAVLSADNIHGEHPPDNIQNAVALLDVVYASSAGLASISVGESMPVGSFTRKCCFFLVLAQPLRDLLRAAPAVLAGTPPTAELVTVRPA